LIPKAEWLACQGSGQIRIKDKIYLGLDLSATTDLTALVAVSAHQDNDIVKAWFFKPEKPLIEHERRDRVPYTVWKQQGFIETTPGASVEYDWVAARLMQIVTDYQVVGLAFDRWGMKHLVPCFVRVGLDFYVQGKDDARAGALRMVDWGQGTKGMNGAITALETSILNRKFCHDGNPVLTWCFSNAMTVMDRAGWRTFDKSKSRFRIDGAVACAMAIGLKGEDIMKQPKKSKYEENGILTI